jgi:hypothetical protein
MDTLESITEESSTTSTALIKDRKIRIVIEGGALQNVENLPPGWDYELWDWDSCGPCVECEEPVRHNWAKNGVLLHHDCASRIIPPPQRDGFLGNADYWTIFPYGWLMDQKIGFGHVSFWRILTEIAFGEFGKSSSEYTCHLEVTEHGYLAWFTRG